MFGFTSETSELERDLATARRHLRQLLHALDRQEDTDGDANLSWRVRFAMKEARKYLQGRDG